VVGDTNDVEVGLEKDWKLGVTDEDDEFDKENVAGEKENGLLLSSKLPNEKGFTAVNGLPATSIGAGADTPFTETFDLGILLCLSLSSSLSSSLEDSSSEPSSL